MSAEDSAIQVISHVCSTEERVDDLKRAENIFAREATSSPTPSTRPCAQAPGEGAYSRTPFRPTEDEGVAGPLRPTASSTLPVAQLSQLWEETLAKWGAASPLRAPAPTDQIAAIGANL